MRAAYTSRCMLCDEQIHEGDEIVRLDEEGEWVHHQCALEEGYFDEQDMFV